MGFLRCLIARRKGLLPPSSSISAHSTMPHQQKQEGVKLNSHDAKVAHHTHEHAAHEAAKKDTRMERHAGQLARWRSATIAADTQRAKQRSNPSPVIPPRHHHCHVI